MKKLTILMAAVALVCFSVPAMAVDWNFYGSARMQTYYVSDDFGDSLNPAGTDDKDAETLWDLQGNSRLGANVKAENIKGQFEFGMDDFGNNVTLRRLYGVWNFGSGWLKVGKDYTPITTFISGQAYDTDLGLLGIGNQYGSRHGQVAFGFGGFEIALIHDEAEAAEDTVVDLDLTTGDPDSVIPKIEARWGMGFDAWNFNLWGGYQYYSVEDVASLTNPGDTNDLDINSWVVGGDAGFNFGPGYVKGQVSYGSNIGNAGWGNPGGAPSTTRSITGQGGYAMWDFDDDVNDTNTLMACLVLGLKVSDMLSFEAGGGYRKDTTDGGTQRDTAPWAVYVQSVIALAPGVYVVPEVGYFDFDNNVDGDDAGSQFYLGGKWQIDF